MGSGDWKGEKEKGATYFRWSAPGAVDTLAGPITIAVGCSLLRRTIMHQDVNNKEETASAQIGRAHV